MALEHTHGINCHNIIRNSLQFLQEYPNTIARSLRACKHVCYFHANQTLAVFNTTFFTYFLRTCWHSRSVKMCTHLDLRSSMLARTEECIFLL